MRLLVVALAAFALFGCKRRPAASVEEEQADAAPADILTPGGRVSPEAVKKQVEETLEKEHEKTLEPKVE